ncbi:MAG: type II toxin-antitoxin system VapB family antitoxin [Chloroflexi bacterium]|nr:type II toxin-antitoxin system VapB family antitoxin [Chloroflexota bacterium]
MALDIKSQDVEKLLEEVVQMTGETKTEAVRKALAERHRRLKLRSAAQRDEVRLLTFLEDEAWPRIPTDQLGKRLSKEEEETILGLGVLGV